MPLSDYPIDLELDLVLEREVEVPRDKVWEAWTTPEILMKWFCPLPWKTIECDIDLRPGGLFRTVMESPEGEAMGDGNGCYLEVVENEKLVWTDALHAEYRPAPAPNDCFGNFFTATILLEDTATGTRYTVIARHSSAEGAKAHEEQGFTDGWGTALEQMVRLIKTGSIT